MTKVALYLSLSILSTPSHGFSVAPTMRRNLRCCILAATNRCCPPPDTSGTSRRDHDPLPPTPQQQPDFGNGQLKQDFQDLAERITTVGDSRHIPSLLSKNDMDLILRVASAPGVVSVVESILQDVKLQQGIEAAEHMNQVLDIILTGAEDFVEHAYQLDTQNKKRLGKIITLLADKSLSDREREDALDSLMAREVECFTPGFLRHVEGDCERIASAPTSSPESTRLLQILRLVQTRVIEELGKDMGEAAQVLGHLIGSDSKSERLAILDAGIKVRVLDFAREMRSLSKKPLMVSHGFRVGLTQTLYRASTRYTTDYYITRTNERVSNAVTVIALKVLIKRLGLSDVRCIKRKT